MKYYSELLNNTFDTEGELLKAEEEFLSVSGQNDLEDDETNKIVQEEKTKQPTKKELAEAVEKCDEALKEAYAMYDVSQKKAEDLFRKYVEEVTALTKEAKEAVAKAEADKYNAIKKFNDSYGVYRVSYTGAKAAEEFERSFQKMFNPKWTSFFDTFFNF